MEHKKPSMKMENKEKANELVGEETKEGGEESASTNMWPILLMLALHWSISSSLTFSNSFLVRNDLPNVAVFVAATQSTLSFLILTPIACWMHKDTCRKILSFDLVMRQPSFLALCGSFVGMQVFNRLALRQVGVACLQISRSLTIVFTVTFTYFLLKSPVRRITLLCCLLVIGGFTLGVNQSPDSVTMKGFVFGLISSAFTSSETTLTKRMLPSFDNSPLLLTAIMNGVSTVIFFPLVFLSGDFSTLLNYWKLLFTPQFIAILLFSSSLSASFGFYTYRVIQMTSPVTLVFSNSAHISTQTIFAVIYFHQMTTPLWWLSNLLILIGTIGYALNKIRDGQNQPDHKPQASKISTV